jgi:hypothetical protein
LQFALATALEKYELLLHFKCDTYDKIAQKYGTENADTFHLDNVSDTMVHPNIKKDLVKYYNDESQPNISRFVHYITGPHSENMYKQNKGFKKITVFHTPHYVPPKFDINILVAHTIFYLGKTHKELYGEEMSKEHMLAYVNLYVQIN